MRTTGNQISARTILLEDHACEYCQAAEGWGERIESTLPLGDAKQITVWHICDDCLVEALQGHEYLVNRKWHESLLVK